MYNMIMGKEKRKPEEPTDLPIEPRLPEEPEPGFDPERNLPGDEEFDPEPQDPEPDPLRERENRG